MGKNKDRKKKGAAVQKTVTKAKKKTEKELKKQIEQLGEVKFIFKIIIFLKKKYLFRIISNN
jgi:hypothetical protein